MGSQPGETVKEQPDGVVTAQECSALVRELSNWNGWGAEDQRGALHFLTAERVAAATRLVRDGVAVSLSLPLNTIPAIHNAVPADHYMTAPTELDRGDEPVEFMKDYVGLTTTTTATPTSTRCATSPTGACCTTSVRRLP